MTVDSSYGGLGHTSYLWFDVNSLGLSYYQFWYYSHGGSSSKLYTTYDESNKMTELDTSVSDKWQKTDCFALPVQYNGRIYIIAEHGGELNEKIAIDNVNLTANCKGKFEYFKFTRIQN